MKYNQYTKVKEKRLHTFYRCFKSAGDGKVHRKYQHKVI